MMRPVAFIVAALEAAAPGFGPKRAAAEHLHALAERHGFDPITMIALVESESRWDPGAFNPRSGARGLGQHLPQNSPSCRKDPLGYECNQLVLCLDDWRCNLTLSARAFERWREFCRKRVGSAFAKFWLQGYQGFDARRATTCGHRRVGKRWVADPTPKLTRKILARRHELIRIVDKPPGRR